MLHVWEALVQLHYVRQDGGDRYPRPSMEECTGASSSSASPLEGMTLVESYQ